MNDNPDKRNDRFISYEGKKYISGFGLFTYIENKIEAPFMINKPNMVSMYLSIAVKSHKTASDLYESKIKPNLKYKESDKTYYLDLTESVQVTFDFLEAIISAIIFAYTAVEGFINSVIPLDYVEENKKEGKVGCEWIQRNVNLLEKIKRVIPQAYNFSFNANEVKSWSNFTNLENYRDSIIHLKSEKLNYNTETEIASTQLNFIQEFVGACMKENIVESAREIITLIASKIGDHPSIPFEFLTKPIDYANLTNKLLQKNL